ncbi:MAG: AsmA family protein [Rhodopseudomonas sp.]|nr:AsmA family protein [Rhodopseudomonas sp.]
MQTTLLGLAIAIILALVTALVGPLLVDWNGYRSIFEAEASHLIGEDVRVTGAIDARLLPSPRLTLHTIEIGKPKSGETTAPTKGKVAAADAGVIRARSLAIEFALTPLLRGQWRATELHIAGPTVGLTIDATGHVLAPNIAVSFNPDSLTVERLGIEDGRVVVTDMASGGVTTFDKLWFNGEARSLIGPFKGEGAVTIGGELYPYRLSTGRYSDAGAIKLHVNVDPVSRPLSMEAEGELTLAGDDPKFQGSLSLAKPVGIAPSGSARLTQPWKLSGKLKADAKSALMENVEFQYGSINRGLKLTGVAEFKFGKTPRFDGVLSGTQIDLDRVLVAGDGSRPPPAAAIRELAELGGAAFRPSIPISIGVGIDQVTLGGSTVQNLRGDITSDDSGWNLDRFEFRAPGFTQVRLSGHLAVDASGVAFTGPAEIDANDPNSLAAWLEGRDAGTAKAGVAEAGPLSLRGDVTLGSEKVAIEKLTARFDRKTVSGRLAYIFGAGDRPSKFDAALNAPELDLDAALGFGRALLAGSTVERPRDMTIAADIGRATVGGFVAHNASARLKIDAGGLQIDKLAVADLGGAAFSASGRIVTTAPSPQGSINVDLTAPDMAPVMALLSRFAPVTVKTLGQKAAEMAPARLHARLTIDGAAPGLAKLGIDGSLGKVTVSLNAQGNADSFPPSSGNLQLDGKVTADDGKTLTALIGIDRALAVGPGPGVLSVKLNGPAGGPMQVDAQLIAKGLDVKANGTTQPFADKPTATLHADILSGNAAPLASSSLTAGDAAAVLPVTFGGRIVLNGDSLDVSDIEAGIGGSTLRGKLAATLSAPHRLSGDIEADTIDGAGLVAAAIGMPAAAPEPAGKSPSSNASVKPSWVWPSEPFGDGVFGDYAGSVGLKVRRLDVSPTLTAREFRSTLRFGKRELAVDDIAGVLAGGRLSGSMTYKDTDGGLTAQAKLALAGADASVLLRSGARPPVTGTLDVSAEVEGTGLSPVALIGSLQGSGKVALSNGQLAGLDPRAFDAVTRAVDQGLPVDSGRLADIVQRALASGQLSVKRAEGPFTVGAGQLRLSSATVESSDAALTLNGTIDLTDGSLDAHMVLSGTSEAAGARPDIFMALKGPVSAPARSVDVSALSGWLTLRAVENQARKLRELEKQRALEAERSRLQPPASAVPPPASAPSVQPEAAPQSLPQSSPPPSSPSATPTNAGAKAVPGATAHPAATSNAAPAQAKASAPIQSTGAARRSQAPSPSAPAKTQLAPKLPAPVDIRPWPHPATTAGESAGSLRP